MYIYMYIYIYIYCKTLLARVGRAKLNVAFEIILEVHNRRVGSLV